MQLTTKFLRPTSIAVFALLFLSAVTHGINMFRFPYYENDEGTYMSQAWSLITSGELAPYTYWYDHAPGGWLLIAIWVKLTGGVFTFGPSINSGRVLMLLIHVFNSGMILYLLRNFGKIKYLAGSIAVLVFSLSPLGIYFQRRVLLDNLMVFWIFVSLFFCLKERLKLSHVIYSSITFGIAVLTKENAIFFAPVFLYLVWSRSDKYLRRFAVFNWLLVMGILVSFYFLYAIIKNEFFPVGFMGDSTEHVSLITTLKNQYSRGESVPFWNSRSDFAQNFNGWLARDSFIIIAGLLATAFNLVLAVKNKQIRYIPLLSFFFWAFLGRGKLVLNFYIVPLIPILAMNIGLALEYLINYLGKRAAVLIAIAPVFLLLAQSVDHFIKDETSPQIKAIDWIKKNVPHDANLVIDDSIYVDLHEARYPNDPVFPNAEWSWKVEKDPEIYKDKLEEDWKNLEYIVLSHEMLRQIKDAKFRFLEEGLDNSFLVADWSEGSSSYIDLENYLSTNGDWMAVYKVNDRNRILLSESWQYYKDNFIVDYGQVIDPDRNSQTTSEGQAYAMLRAVWQNDKRTFDGVWQWTQDHLQHRIQDELISWAWIKENGEYKLGDSAPATDADLDISLSLVFAAKKWRDPYYLREARKIIADIWDNEVKLIGDRYILLPGVSGFETETHYLVNSSYFSPAWYRIFAEVDPLHPWLNLADDTYILLDEISNLSGTTNLPPNWVAISKQTGKPIDETIEINGGDEYSYDAFRIFWRVSLDHKWFNDNNAKLFLEKYLGFFSNEWSRRKSFSAVYAINGEAKEQFSTPSTNVAPLVIFSTLGRLEAEEVYIDLFENTNKWWGNKTNYYDQNWAWFGVALYHNLLPMVQLEK